jgi:hypothetical protein
MTIVIRFAIDGIEMIIAAPIPQQSDSTRRSPRLSTPVRRFFRAAIPQAASSALAKMAGNRRQPAEQEQTRARRCKKFRTVKN